MSTGSNTVVVTLTLEEKKFLESLMHSHEAVNKFGKELEERFAKATQATNSLFSALSGGATSGAASGLLQTTANLALTGEGFGELINILGEFTRKGLEAETAEFRLESSIKNLGLATGITREQVRGLSKDLQESTAFSSPQSNQAVIALMRAGVHSQDLGRILHVAADYAAQTGDSLPGAANMLGRMFASPRMAAGHLRRMGLASPDEVYELQYKSKTGDIAGAREMMLKLFEKGSEDAAAKFTQTIPGQWQKMMNELTESEEEFGRDLMRVGIKLEPLFVSMAKGVIKVTEAFVSLCGPAIELAAKLGKDLGNSIGALDVEAKIGVIMSKGALTYGQAMADLILPATNDDDDGRKNQIIGIPGSSDQFFTAAAKLVHDDPKNAENIKNLLMSEAGKGVKWNSLSYADRVGLEGQMEWDRQRKYKGTDKATHSDSGKLLESGHYAEGLLDPNALNARARQYYIERLTGVKLDEKALSMIKDQAQDTPYGDDNMIGHQRTFDGLEQLNRRIAEAAGSPEGYGKDDATKQNTDAVNKNTEALNKKTENAASQRPGGLR